MRWGRGGGSPGGLARWLSAGLWLWLWSVAPTLTRAAEKFPWRPRGDANGPSTATNLNRAVRPEGYSLVSTNGAWSLVNPAGIPFFSLGICCANPGLPRELYDPENPSYAAWRYYPNSLAWATNTRARLKSWGFNTLGGWSDAALLAPSDSANPAATNAGFRTALAAPSRTAALVVTNLVVRNGMGRYVLVTNPAPTNLVATLPAGTSNSTSRGTTNPVPMRSGLTNAWRTAQPTAFHLTPVLHLGAAAGAPWWDLWDTNNVQRLEATAREQMAPYRDHPGLIGYYSDNELGWWNAALWKSTLEQPPNSGQRQQLLRLVRESYTEDWGKMLEDFDVEGAADWSQLARGGMLYLRPGGEGVRIMRLFLGLVAERYYGLMRELIRRHDPRALFLGDRYPSFYYPEIAAVAGRHADVVSCNLNAQFADGTFLRSFLPALHLLSQRPVLVTEYYAAATTNQSGNRNSGAGFLVVPGQAERTAATRRTLHGLLRLPFVVGADWFQYSDEPQHGRDDGENFNFGLVDIHDQPYPELTGMFARLRPGELRWAGFPPLRDAGGGIPPAPPNPLGQFKPPTALTAWDRERGYLVPTSPTPVPTDLYAAWSPQALYLGLYSLDLLEGAYYRGPFIPKQDRAQLIVKVNGREIVRARLGANRDAIGSDPRVRIENSSGLGSNTANVAALEIPVKLLGAFGLQAGDSLLLSIELQTHARAYTVRWDGRYILTGPGPR